MFPPMESWDLTAIDFIEGTTQIRLRRRGPEPPQAMPYTPAPIAAPPPIAAAPAPSAPTPPPTSPAAPSGSVIRSPMVGTFYVAGSPDSTRRM